MFPPTLGADAWDKLPHLLAETGEMALFGTALGVVLALPFGLLSARNVAPWFVAVPVRRFLEALRAMPEVVWGLVLVAIAGIGPSAGILALGLHSAGCLGRLFAELFENVRPAPVLAVASTGASPLAVASYAIVPLAFGPLGVHSLFRLEWNLRQATVVGMIGAGGIGQALVRSAATVLLSADDGLSDHHLGHRARRRPRQRVDAQPYWRDAARAGGSVGMSGTSL